jgi:hypothetical protein
MMTDSPKLKLKSSQDKLPFWMRISDVLRLAKPFEMRVNMSQEQCLRAIGKLGSPNYRGKISRTYITKVNGTRFSVERPGTRNIEAAIYGEIQGDPNLEVTLLKGKAYADFSIVVMYIPMFLIGFGIDGEDIYFRTYWWLFCGAVIVLALLDGFYNRYKVVKDFKTHFSQFKSLELHISVN